MPPARWPSCCLAARRRMDAAKRILHQVISDLPDRPGVNVGLRVYGHEGDNTQAGKAVSCRASELLVPIAGVDEATLMAQVDAIQPTGWTPIAYSLQQAAADFQPGGESITNAVVLVTDGEETCDPPEQSCQAAASLHQSDVSGHHPCGRLCPDTRADGAGALRRRGGGWAALRCGECPGIRRRPSPRPSGRQGCR